MLYIYNLIILISLLRELPCGVCNCGISDAIFGKFVFLYLTAIKSGKIKLLEQRIGCLDQHADLAVEYKINRAQC